MTGLHFVYQNILLLALRDDRGTPVGSWASYAVGGGLLADLLLAGRISLDGKRQLVTLENAEPVGDPLLDACLLQIAEAGRRASAQRWVTRFASKKNFRAAAERLCDLGVLRVEAQSVLLLFTRHVYPEIDPAPERAVVEGLREAIFGDATPDSGTAVLVSLASAADLLAHHFPKKDLRARRARIKAIAAEDAVGAATAKVIQGVQAAIVAATVAGAAAATS